MLPLQLPGPLWSEVVVPVRVWSMGQIELFINHLLYLKSFNWVQTNDWSSINLNGVQTND